MKTYSENIITERFAQTANNYNLGIFGPPTAGKTKLVKLVLLRDLAKEPNTKIYLFSTALGEYERFVKYFRGENIEIPQSKERVTISGPTPITLFQPNAVKPLLTEFFDCAHNALREVLLTIRMQSYPDGFFDELEKTRAFGFGKYVDVLKKKAFFLSVAPRPKRNIIVFDTLDFFPKNSTFYTNAIGMLERGKKYNTGIVYTQSHSPTLEPSEYAEASLEYTAIPIELNYQQKPVFLKRDKNTVKKIPIKITLKPEEEKILY
ncbi:MAG: hypothetical protein QME47_06005 [Candidatus Thermoplasmatota archaeon]|nr:hypothetical protein [Candidatus Thermoplasmatota archaeon]